MAIVIHAARATHNWWRAGVWRGDRMYHVLSDQLGPAGTTELVAFVTSCGLRAEWMQYPGTYREHYDARFEDGARLIAAGARLVTNRELGTLLAYKRAAYQKPDTSAQPPSTDSTPPGSGCQGEARGTVAEETPR
jgi:hypothetical protein